MSEKPVLIDLDAPSKPSRQPMPWSLGRRGRLRSAKISFLAALGLMIASGAAGGALGIYGKQYNGHVRVVAVSANIVPDSSPEIAVSGKQARLDGNLGITNLGTSPITIVGLRMRPAEAQIHGSISRNTVDPGTTSNISVTVTLTCIKGSVPKLNAKASLLVQASAEAADSGSPIAFENGRWGEQMLLACLNDVS